jgi:RES domain-containing protein
LRYVTVDIPDGASTGSASPDAVPGWDAMPPGASCAFGDAWLRGRETLVLLVPSVVTSGLDLNAVINPLHPDFARIVVGDAATMRWDARLLPASAGE